MTKEQCFWILGVSLIVAGKINGVPLSDVEVRIPDDSALAPRSKILDTVAFTQCVKLPFDSFLLLQEFGRGVGPGMVIHNRTKMALVQRDPYEPLPQMEPQDHNVMQQFSIWGNLPAWMLQKIFTPQQQTAPKNPCRLETNSLLILLICLGSTICFVLCTSAFLRKNQDITPLCPALLLNEDLTFTTPFDGSDDIVVIDTKKNAPICRVTTRWPDPAEPQQRGTKGRGATLCVSNMYGTVLASAIVKKQGIALSRTGSEIFGFIDPDGKNDYYVRHLTGLHLLSLVGNFDTFDIDGFNRDDTKVFTFKQVNGTWTGKVIQNADAGLMFCSLFATHVHQKLMVKR